MLLARHLNHASHRRGGVIPYCVKNDQLYVLLGTHAASGDLTDFGGGVTKNETTLEGALREFGEESQSIFGSEAYSINSYETCVAVQNTYMAVIFYPLHPKYFDAPLPFVKNKEGDELSSIKWYTFEEFVTIAFDESDNRMWKKIQRFLCETISKPDEFKEVLIRLNVYAHLNNASIYN